MFANQRFLVDNNIPSKKRSDIIKVLKQNGAEIGLIVNAKVFFRFFSMISVAGLSALH
jgi:hypothetical protein